MTSGQRSKVFINRFVSALVWASVGAALGLLYAKNFLPPERQTKVLLGLYGGWGGAFGVLVARLSVLILSIVRDFRDRSR